MADTDYRDRTLRVCNAKGELLDLKSRQSGSTTTTQNSSVSFTAHRSPCCPSQMTPAEQLASFKLYLSGISYDESSGWIEYGIKSGRVTFCNTGIIASIWNVTLPGLRRSETTRMPASAG